MLSHYSDKNMGRLCSKLGNKSNVNDHYWAREATFKNNWFGTHDRPHGVHFIAFIVVGRISVSLMSLATPVKLRRDQANFLLHSSIVFIFRIQSSDKMARKTISGERHLLLGSPSWGHWDFMGNAIRRSPECKQSSAATPQGD